MCREEKLEERRIKLEEDQLCAGTVSRKFNPGDAFSTTTYAQTDEIIEKDN